MNVSPDQLATAGSYIARNWGDYGYRVEGIEPFGRYVNVFHVVASDGSRFMVAVDRWSNAKTIPEGEASDGPTVVAMAREAATV